MGKEFFKPMMKDRTEIINIEYGEDTLILTKIRFGIEFKELHDKQTLWRGRNLPIYLNGYE